MKANELMIGDWVECVDSTHKKKVYAQIDAIEEGQTCILVRLDNCNWFLDISFIKPIPLTRNILESNGWSPVKGVCASILRHNGYNLSILHLAKPGVNLTIDKGGYGPNFVCMPIYYVHELQHALRLCGIDKNIEL